MDLIPVLEKRNPALFLTQPRYTYVVSKNIQSVSNQRLSRPADRFQQTFDWYIKTRWSWN